MNINKNVNLINILCIFFKYISNDVQKINTIFNSYFFNEYSLIII